MKERMLKIPEGITVKKEGVTLSVKGARGESKRNFFSNDVKIEIRGGEVVISASSDRRRVKAVAGTWEAHAKNMFRGAAKGYTAQLKLVYSHFPVKMSIVGNKFVISNFLGEKQDRYANVLPGVKVEIKKEFIELSGLDKEIVGQTAANIEAACRIKKKDRRVFADGIWIIRKPGMEDGA
jgi:large subunit ribosomal protein L6